MPIATQQQGSPLLSGSQDTRLRSADQRNSRQISSFHSSGQQQPQAQRTHRRMHATTQQAIRYVRRGSYNTNRAQSRLNHLRGRYSDLQVMLPAPGYFQTFPSEFHTSGLWRLEYDHAQELTGVLREGLGDMLEARSGPDGLPGAKALHQANAFSAAPLFKKLVLSDNPALGFRVIDGGRTIRGWVFISDLVEEEELQAGELAKLMHSVGVFCEEIRLSNVNLLASHLAFSPFQRVLELDHTAIEDSMILSALERATCISPKAQSLPATAGSAIAKETTSLLVEVCRSYKGETTLSTSLRKKKTT
ncbi:hypothetical protein A4X13_0g9306 [Tilletia indica]|uniref:Uncharacterized protein n=1 Tax=Tilletia indica TaxID=43049 RepID=A0A8T8SAC1_9BASI|nr:hypothetical protein A4X13_0g9306 [Tilletia indica]